jgi:hypothetical protein
MIAVLDIAWGITFFLDTTLILINAQEISRPEVQLHGIPLKKTPTTRNGQ